MSLNRNYLIIGSILIAGLLFIFSFSGRSRMESQTDFHMKKIFLLAGYQTEIMLTEIDKTRKEDPGLVSPRTIKSGKLTLVPTTDWTSGFFSGNLWFLYEYTGDETWRRKAETFTAKMEKEKWSGVTHDMGFKINCSFGNGYRLTDNETYRDVIIQAARTLMTRFNPVIGSLRSWDHSRDKWRHPVIIDNMMNLELLFLATSLTGDPDFYDVAVAHAKTTIKNHYRPDFSTYHVVDYDALTGKVIKKNTHQGLSDESAWSRGQAWALYGMIVCYRATREEVFLTQAEKTAQFILDHPNLPEDLVPYWDFDAPGIPTEPRDASAAAIMASALYELSIYSKNGESLKDTADKILTSLAAGYASQESENLGFILGHSTGSKPSDSEVDVPIIYADYYYLEALLRKQTLEKNGKL